MAGACCEPEAAPAAAQAVLDVPGHRVEAAPGGAAAGILPCQERGERDDVVGPKGERTTPAAQGLAGGGLLVGAGGARVAGDNEIDGNVALLHLWLGAAGCTLVLV